MSLLDEWEGSGSTYGAPAFAAELAGSEPIEAELGSPRHGTNRAQFSLDTVERQINRCAVLLLACAALVQGKRQCMRMCTCLCNSHAACTTAGP